MKKILTNTYTEWITVATNKILHMCMGACLNIIALGSYILFMLVWLLTPVPHQL